MTKDELKALWAELGENHYNHRIGDYANDIPAGPPRPGFDVCDRFVPRFHAVLETHIRGQKQALLGNLRGFPPRGTANEVWNQGIGKYTATYHAVPGKGERSVRLEVEIFANSGSCLNGDDDKPAGRQVRVHPRLRPRRQGRRDQPAACRLDLASAARRCSPRSTCWRSPRRRWQGHNPYVTEANVRSIDLANGGGGRIARRRPRRRSAPSPSTRPAAPGCSPTAATRPATAARLQPPGPRRPLPRLLPGPLTTPAPRPTLLPAPAPRRALRRGAGSFVGRRDPGFAPSHRSAEPELGRRPHRLVSPTLRLRQSSSLPISAFPSRVVQVYRDAIRSL